MLTFGEKKTCTHKIRKWNFEIKEKKKQKSNKNPEK